ncbi:MAG: tetratricopeptide repeat protein [Anaerosomatales bacterium]|nr:tetratricopeptide repeat protein [Anaerosomatales bacterium]
MARSQQAMIAEGLARQGRVAEAVAACHEALAIDERDAATHALLADLLLGEDFYDEAIATATQGIELDPDCSPAYLALGLAYDRRGGMWDQSVLVWHELAEVVPDLVIAHVQLGEAFSAAAFDEEARDSWRRALELDPHQARAHYNLAIDALKREGMPTALPMIRAAGALDPSQDALFFALVGLPDREPSGDVGPDAPREVRYAEAVALARAEDFFGAADVVRTLLDDDPSDAKALALAGFCYLKQEAMNEAMACAVRALADSPELVEGLYVLGTTYAQRPGLAKHAARVFLALAKAAPGQPLTHVLLAEALLGLQRYRQARKAYRAAVALDPACVRARFGLAAVLFSEGAYAEAQWHIRRAAYYDTKRLGTFWELFDRYVEEASA